MKTKREVLKEFVKKGHCENIVCDNCPYDGSGCSSGHCSLNYRLRKIGAMALLRQNRNKEFDPSKILTCATVYQASEGMKGYFGNNVRQIEDNIRRNSIDTLIRIDDNKECLFPFRDRYGHYYSLFYPMEDKE